MAIKGLTLSESEVSQEINVEKIVGTKLPDDLMQEIAQASLDYMLDRVAEGKGVGGKSLPSPYSKSYSGSLDFKAAGKSKGDVNMKLSGDMLGSIEIETDPSKFKMIIPSDEAPKAYGHMTGFKGHPTIGSKNKDGVSTKREFFGLTETEFKAKVLNKFSDDIKAARRSNDQGGDTAATLAKIIKASDLFGDDNGF